MLHYTQIQLIKTVLLVIIGIVTTHIVSAQPMHRPKVAVVLSGGGAKGFTHIGVLEVLEKEGIPIDIIVGTSMGSVIGGLYSIGYSTKALSDMCLTENWAQLLTDYVPRKQLDQYAQEEQQRYVLTVPVYTENKPEFGNGVVRGQNVINLFCKLASNIAPKADFSKFPISFACIGTDLNTGKEVVLQSGFLPTAIFSSMAIPGVFAPIKYNQYLFVDGGVVNNFPVDVAKQMGADIVIGVNLNKDYRKRESVSSIIDLSSQLVGILTAHKDSTNKALCDVLIEPNLTGYNSSSFTNNAADTLIRRGRESAMATIQQIRALKTKYNLQPQTISDSLTILKSLKITDIQFTGKYSLSIKLLQEVMDLHTPGTYSFSDIKNSIGSLYGMGVFDRVYFKLIPNSEGKTLNVVLEERKSLNLNVGMRLNSKSMVSITLNATRKNYSNIINLLSFTTDISSNPRFNFLAEMNKSKLPKIAFTLEGSYSDMKIHNTREYTYPTSIYYGAAKLYTYQRLHRYSLLGAGIKEELAIERQYQVTGNREISLKTTGNAVTNYYVYYNFDNLDHFYFPTKGFQLYTEFTLAHNTNSDKIRSIALIKAKNTLSINSNLAVLTSINARSIFLNQTPQFLKNHLTSNEYESFFYHYLPFYGAPSVWTLQNNAAVGSLGMRCKIFKRNYVTLSTNYLLQTNHLNQLSDYEGMLGVGLTYSFRTNVGPIEFTLGYSDAYGKLVTTGNIGFWF
ncbi:MAG: patatin-like phospholipase family protein [Paludibacteraceae bacterium]